MATLVADNEDTMTEERKHAILFAATLLSARKLTEMDPNKSGMAKGNIVDTAIDAADFILERIDNRWPAASTRVATSGHQE